MAGKRVVITGGAQGIGLAVTKELLRRGSKICILDVNAATGQDTQQKLRNEFGQDCTKFITCDVTNEARFSKAVEEAKQFLGFINVFVNNAGIVDEYNIERCVGINLIAVIRGTNLAMQHMSKLNGGQGGQIINVASIAARVAVPYFPTYCGTKSGVLHYTSSWAKNPDAGEMGITFQSICPVFTDTPLVQNFENKVFRHQQLKTYLDDVGYITVERVVEAFMRLLDDNINGGIIEVKYDATTYTHEEDKKTSDDKLKI